MAHFELPEGRILPVNRLRLGMASTPHPFATRHAAEIAANWHAERAKKPALFNGEVIMPSVLRWHDGTLEGTCHVVDYATLMFWRRVRPVADMGHIYAHAMPVTRENALVAVRMATSTVNGGQVYFAAGSFEPLDVTDGFVDVEGNMRREVLEETGLDIGGLPADDDYRMIALPTGTVLFRRYLLEADADEIAARIRDFVARGLDPHAEIDGPVVIASEKDMPPEVPSQMPPLVRWHFENPPGGAPPHS